MTSETLHETKNASLAKKTKTKKPLKESSFLKAEALYPVVFKNTLAKGKHLVTKNNTKAGTLVLAETSPAYIVRSSISSSLCHLCIKPVPFKEVSENKLDEQGEPIPDQTTTVKRPEITCPDCKFAVYCSSDCLTKDSSLHGKECKALAFLAQKESNSHIDIDKLRTIIRMAIRSLDDSQPEFTADPNLETPPRFMAEIPSHRESFEKPWIENTIEEVKEIIPLLPIQNNQKNISEMVSNACRYQTNVIPFYDFIYRGIQDAYGIFPMTSIYLKHSCVPNCAIIGDSQGRIAVRTLIDLPKGTELTATQTELYQPREHRRRDLLLNKHFWCKCRRCSVVLSKSVDQYMDGIVCKKCNMGLMIFEETKEVDDVNELMKNTSLLDDEIKGKFALCNNCNHKISVSELVDILRDAIESFSSAFHQYRSRNIEQARKMFEDYLKKFEGHKLLHPYNSYIVNSYVPLMHCCRAMNDITAAINYCRTAINQMVNSNAYTPNFPDVTELRVTLGELLLESAQSKSANAGKSIVSRNLSKKYFNEAKESFETALKEREIACGKNHFRYEQTRNYLNYAEKAPLDLEISLKANSANQAKLEEAKTEDATTQPPKKVIKKKVPKKLPQEMINSIQSKAKTEKVE
ncbi:hypothetical protein BB559_000850 [Furculomyces boomerangus]|uniref:MYND-type domain-containing protein n=2 Tax=Harpellales TaxID=61421 RepID=A0A2T9Z3Y5_9FUNG|nr:hypothetical protein BB559_000850 [Furculomyces boomerangus]PWA03376.1 hypothetical protein BB558_000459 [Smittium angustum]